MIFLPASFCSHSELELELELEPELSSNPAQPRPATISRAAATKETLCRENMFIDSSLLDADLDRVFQTTCLGGNDSAMSACFDRFFASDAPQRDRQFPYREIWTRTEIAPALIFDRHRRIARLSFSLRRFDIHRSALFVLE